MSAHFLVRATTGAAVDEVAVDKVAVDGDVDEAVTGFAASK